MVWLRVLGPVTAELDGVPVPLGGPRQRAVLAMLVIARGEVVSVDRMAENLWRGEPPAKALVSLQAYVSNLRKLLEPGRPPRAPARLLVSAPPGYALRLPDEAVDAWRFERLLRDARELAPEQPAAARAMLAEALALWRGPAFAEAADEPWVRAEAAALAEARHLARELRVAAALDAGDAATVTAEAELLTRDEPLREEGWRLLALALWAGGRQAEALDAVRRARKVFAEELGLDPSPVLTEVETAILAGRADVLPASGRPRPTLPPPARPAGPGDGLFVGRDTELAALTGLAGGGIALVTGEAGLGKSALLTALSRRLADAGWLVATGRCTEAAGAPAAWPWAEVAGELARVVPAPPGDQDALAPLLAAGDAEPAVDAAAGRFRLHRAVCSWLASAARARPVAVLLDDLHRADAETRALLVTAAAGLAGANVLFVAAFRPDEADESLGETLAALAKQSPLRLPLTGLPERAVAEVVEALCDVPVDAGTVAALARRTGGNPFYVRESARLLRSEGALVAVSEVPEGVRDVLRRRLARLPDAAVSVLRLAALTGRESDVEVLVEAADADEDGVLGALEAGLLAGLLDEPAPGRVRFVHELVRDTLVADLSGLRARRLHGRIAAVLERLSPGDVPALAHHYTRAAAAATAGKAVGYGIRAAEAAERRYAHDTAVTFLSDALTSFDRLPGGTLADHVDLLGKLLRAQIRAGAVAAARATRQRAIGLAEEAGRDDLVIAAFAAWTEPTPWQTHPYGTEDAPVVALLSRLLRRSGLAPDVRSRLLDAYAVERADNGNPDARAAAEEAVALAADPRLRAHALATLSRELDADLEWREKAELGRELDRLGTEHGLPVYRCYGRIVEARAAAAAGAVAEVHRLVSEALDLARAYHLAELIDVGELARAMAAHLAGDFAGARRRYAEAGERMARRGSVHGRAYRRLGEALVQLDQAEWTGFAETAAGLYRDFGPLAADLHALGLAATNRPEEAHRVRQRARPLRRDCFFTLFATFRALAVVALGRPEEATALYEDLLPYAKVTAAGAASLTLATRPVARTLGELALLRGDDEAAAAHFADAAAEAERWRVPGPDAGGFGADRDSPGAHHGIAVTPAPLA